MTFPYSSEQFVEAMRKAVAERGEDFVYPIEWRLAGEQNGICQYTIDGAPACIVGAALYHMTGKVYEGLNESADEVLRTYFGIANEAVTTAAAHAQEAQDANKTWGEALKEFEVVLAEAEEN